MFLKTPVFGFFLTSFCLLVRSLLDPALHTPTYVREQSVNRSPFFIAA